MPKAPKKPSVKKNTGLAYKKNLTAADKKKIDRHFKRMDSIQSYKDKPKRES